MFSWQLDLGGHTRIFRMTSMGAEGWALQVTQDDQTVRAARYTDWHRVERAIAGVEREVAGLRESGWRLAAAPLHSTNR